MTGATGVDSTGMYQRYILSSTHLPDTGMPLICGQ